MATNYNPRIVTGGLVLCLDAGNYKSHLRYSSGWSGTYGSATNSFDGSTSTASGVVGGTFSATYTFPTPLITSSSTVRIFTGLGASSGQIGSTVNIILINGVDITQKLKNAGAYAGSEQWIDITTEVGGVFKTIQLNGTSGVSNPGIYAVEVGGQVLVDSVTWTDLSGNGNNGTLVNGVGYNSGNGGSLSFDGSNDYVEITGNTSNTPPSMTLFCFVYPKNTRPEEIISTQNNGSGYRFMSRIYAGNTGTRWGFRPTPGGPEYQGTTSLSNNTWYCLAVTYTTSNLILYLNGNVELDQSTPSTLTHGGNIRLGDGIGGAQRHLQADLPIFMMYNRALSASEIQQNYNATKSRFQ